MVLRRIPAGPTPDELEFHIDFTNDTRVELEYRVTRFGCHALHAMPADYDFLQDSEQQVFVRPNQSDWCAGSITFRGQGEIVHMEGTGSFTVIYGAAAKNERYEKFFPFAWRSTPHTDDIWSDPNAGGHDDPL